MKPEQAKVGVRVRMLAEWATIPVGTEGVIVEGYGTGVTVAWDLPSRGFPKPHSSFNESDFGYLEVHPMYAAKALDQAITEHDREAGVL